MLERSARSSTKGCKGDADMDKQTNILTNPQGLIPVNIRTIGAPEGIYILYLEDYVHTFIKKILSGDQQNVLLRNRQKREEDQEYQVERTSQQEIALYGRSIEENGRYRLVISGAAAADGGTDRIRQLNNTYFPSCSYIGNAYVSLNKDSRLRLELTLRSTRVILDDFYIYYDQNEEMQNYLVEWNTTRENEKGKVVLSPAEHDTHVRSSASDAAQLSRITQAYNREEAKVSFMWNIMNVLCLGFVVCVMAYGIISMNNYNKMQNMQANIDYCMAFIEENTSFLLGTAKTDSELDKSQPVSAMQHTQRNDGQENLTDTEAVQDGAPAAVEAGQTTQELPTVQGQEQTEASPEITQAFSQDLVVPGEKQAAQPDTVQTAQEETAQPDADQAAQPDGVRTAQGETAQSESPQPDTSQTTQSAQEQTQTPQYYVVRRGDTLRTISYDIYGDYSRVDEICRWNNIDDPNNILYGQKLLLP